MSHNITVEGGTSVRLKTAGKYCDRDIVVTAESGPPTPTQEKTVEITKNGTYAVTPDEGYALSKATANVNVPIPEGYIKPSGTKVITENGTHDAKAYESVNVNVPVPEGYIQPSGTLEVTENGTFDVTDKASVNVNVESGDGGSDDMAGKLADRTITDFYSSSCTAIEEYSFRSCDKLKTLVAPNAKLVGTYALYGCSALKSIVLPSVTTVTTNSFREASNLEVVDLPKLTSIPATTFYGCRGLKALILRSETMVTLSNTNAFTQCYRILGTKNSGYNPKGEKIGFFYVPKALIEQYQVAPNWSSDSLVTQFRAIEDYPEICG